MAELNDQHETWCYQVSYDKTQGSGFDWSFPCNHQHTVWISCFCIPDISSFGKCTPGTFMGSFKQLSVNKYNFSG